MDFKTLIGFVMSEKCYETYFHKFDFFDGKLKNVANFILGLEQYHIL